MITKHTPTPWKIALPESAPHRIFTDDEAVLIADTHPLNGAADGSAEANAAHVVHCVNNFDNLFDIAERCERTLRIIEEEHPKIMGRAVRQRLIADTRTALAAAKKPQHP